MKQNENKYFQKNSTSFRNNMLIRHNERGGILLFTTNMLCLKKYTFWDFFMLEFFLYKSLLSYKTLTCSYTRQQVLSQG